MTKEGKMKYKLVPSSFSKEFSCPTKLPGILLKSTGISQKANAVFMPQVILLGCNKFVAVRDGQWKESYHSARHQNTQVHTSRWTASPDM